MKDLAPILIVDDSDDDVELFRLGLSELHLANPVEVCRDGVEALDYLMRRGAWAQRTGPQPLFMLLDIKMPRMDGLEVLRELRGDPALRALPIVMLTSSREQRDIIESYELGVNGYVVKPVAMAEFIQAIQRVGLFWALLNEPPPERLARPPDAGRNAA